MKKTITLLVFILITVSSFAQNQQSAHLSFKGVPIDGTLNEYVNKMKQNGFSLVNIEDGVARLEGDFAGYKNCSVLVATLKNKDLVSQIKVLFPDCNTWSSLYANYFNLKDLLTEKYGKPSDSLEQFQNIVNDDDNLKMLEVRMNGCKFLTTYDIEKGRIQLSIGNNLRTGYVMLIYFDKINGGIIKAHAIDDL